MDSVWRLTIEKDNGQVVQIFGLQATLMAELNAWTDHENRNSDEWAEAEEIGQTHLDPSAGHVRHIDGFMDDAARSRVIVAYRFVDVVGMCLCQFS